MAESERKPDENGKLTERFSFSASLQPVAFHEDEFMSLVGKLYQKYPGAWLAMIVDNEDHETGLTAGRLILADEGGDSPVAAVHAYRREHPETVVRLFCTGMAAPVPYGF